MAQTSSVKSRTKRMSVKTMPAAFLDHGRSIINSHWMVTGLMPSLVRTFGQIPDDKLSQQKKASTTVPVWQIMIVVRCSQSKMHWLGDHHLSATPHIGFSPDINSMDVWFFNHVKSSVGHRLALSTGLSLFLFSSFSLSPSLFLPLSFFCLCLKLSFSLLPKAHNHQVLCPEGTSRNKRREEFPRQTKQLACLW